MGSFAFLSDRVWLRALARDAIGKDFWGFLAAAIGFGVLCWWWKGAEVTLEAIRSDVEMLLKVLPRIFLALSIAALIWVMLPRDRISGLVGQVIWIDTDAMTTNQTWEEFQEIPLCTCRFQHIKCVDSHFIENH